MHPSAMRETVRPVRPSCVYSMKGYYCGLRPFAPPPRIAPMNRDHARRSMRALAVALTLGATPLRAQQPPLNPNQQLAHDVYKELIETNTSNMTSGTTAAAQEMAKRYRDAGFAESDIF